MARTSVDACKAPEAAAGRNDSAKMGSMHRCLALTCRRMGSTCVAGRRAPQAVFRITTPLRQRPSQSRQHTAKAS
jgi:hypothetical protein